MQNGKVTQLLRGIPGRLPVYQAVRKYLSAAVDLVLPPRCVITGEIVDRPGMIDPSVWARINFIAEPFCDICGKPFDFESGGANEAAGDTAGGSVCVSCLQHKPPYDRGRSALLYDDSSKDIILRFKYADQTHIAYTLAHWLARAGEEFLKDADLLLPVPLHRYRLLKRRYNQAALLSKALSRRVGIPSIPDGLLRTRSTPSQGVMNFKERRKNVKKAFAVNPAQARAIEGKSVVLIDDVYTSGATIFECSRALKDAGAERIYSLTAARVSGTDYFR